MTRIGRYEVEAEIGRGTMGVVYVARDPRLERRVALKTYTVPDGLPAERRRELEARFIREARAAAVLSHPAIVTVYDAEQDPATGVPFIAMEYVPGSTLRDLLDGGGPLEPERAVPIVSSAADALGEAHAAGIVHRDVKPANILIREPEQTTKLTDFGVARLSSSELTESGIALGSPAYMAPEQIAGRPVDGRSDLFSLAVILYELLCGERPFGADDTPALLYAIVHQTPVPITKRRPGLSPRLDAFFDRALAKSPDDRYQDSRSFKAALADAASSGTAPDVEATVVERPPPAAGKPELSRRRPVLVAIAALVLVLGAWSIFGNRGTVFLRLDGRSSVEAGELVLLVDGREVYQRRLAAPQARKRGLIKKVLDTPAETFEAWVEISPGKHELEARITPDGTSQPYRDTVVVDLEPGESRKLRLVAGRSFGRDLSLKLN